MPTFGRKASDSSGSAGGGFYIKTFKEKHTPVRFCIGNPNDFTKVQEHFDKANNISYPCAIDAGAEECVGHMYPVEHPEWENLDEAGLTKEQRKEKDPGWAVRDTAVKYIFPVINKDGYVDLYKIGWNFFKVLRDTYDLIKESGQDYSTCDYTVIRSGENWNDISYSAQATSAPYERTAKVAIPSDEVISATLGAKYRHAMETYGFDTSAWDAEVAGNDPAPVSNPQTNAPAPAAVPAAAAPPDPAPVVAGGIDPAHQLPPAEPTEAARPGDLASEALAAATNARAEAGLPGPTEAFNPSEAERDEIVAFLKAEPAVEFSEKAPRTVLVNLAKKKLADAQPPF